MNPRKAIPRVSPKRLKLTEEGVVNRRTGFKKPTLESLKLKKLAAVDKLLAGPFLTTAKEMVSKPPIKRRPTQKRRKTTGELVLLDRLIEERGSCSEISGDPLFAKGHFQYHWQLFHVLGKGEYPELRLAEFNVLLSTPNEQAEWTNRKHLLRNKAIWKKVFALEAELKLEARTK